MTRASLPHPEVPRILVASPIEPSGASWLLNCFLELGIRVDHKPVVDRMWRKPAPPAACMWRAGAGGGHALHPRAGVLQKFLPALTRRAEFRFRDDVVVDYVQDFPSRRPVGDPVVLFVRDPGDAIYSSYRRAAPAMGFERFVGFPNPQTLLDRPAHWTLFMAAWLALPVRHVVRFEDYKRDADATLHAVLAALGLSYADGDVAEAVRLSSFEKAREAEQTVRDRYPFDRQLANRSGTVGDARGAPLVQASLTRIVATASTVLRQLGYDVQAAPLADMVEAARLSVTCLAFFDTVRLPDLVASVPASVASSAEAACKVLDFAHRADRGVLTGAGLSPADLRLLLGSLAEFTRRHAEWLARHLDAGRSAYGDDSPYAFERIRQARQLARGGGEAESAGS